MAAAAILDNFLWPYLHNSSRPTYIARIARAVIFAIAQLSCFYYRSCIIVQVTSYLRLFFAIPLSIHVFHIATHIDSVFLYREKDLYLTLVRRCGVCDTTALAAPAAGEVLREPKAARGTSPANEIKLLCYWHYKLLNVFVPIIPQVLRIWMVNAHKGNFRLIPSLS